MAARRLDEGKRGNAVTQNPTYYCARCHTTRPPLFAIHTYRCVMCGKKRTVEEYKRELEKLRAEAPTPTYVSPSPRLDASRLPDAETRAEVYTPPTKKVPAVPKPPPAPKAPVVAKAEPEVRLAPAPVVPAKAEPAPKPAPPPVVEAKVEAAPKPAPAPVVEAKAEPAPVVEAKAEPAPKAKAPKSKPAKGKAEAAVTVTSVCAWKDCDNAPRDNAKYCSRACSNKNARWRHAQRRATEG